MLTQPCSFREVTSSLCDNLSGCNGCGTWGITRSWISASGVLPDPA